MPLNAPLYDPAAAITGKATGAAITGCRIVTVAATKPDGGATPIKHCGAADVPIGASADDCAENGHVAVYKNGFVVDVLVGGTGVTFGEVVEVMATGVVQDLASGTACGVALTTTAAAGFAKVILRV
jgi:hypothetical protein